MQWTIGKGKKAQNAPEKTPPQQLRGNETIQKEKKNQKELLPKNRLYSDQAIAVAKAAVKGSR